MIALGALAAYTTEEGEVLPQTAVIAGVLAAACFASVTIWAGLGAAIARFLGSAAPAGPSTARWPACWWFPSCRCSGDGWHCA